MKTLLTIGFLAYSLGVIAQTKLEKSIPLQGAKKIEFSFDYPELIQVHTWEKQEVMIKGLVSINRGEHDNRYEIRSESKDNGLYIKGEIRDKDNIPRRTIIKKGDQEYFFKAADASDPQVQKFLEENGRDYTYISNGIIQEITLEIFVPQGIHCVVNAKFGLVEITNFNAPIVVNAPHGGIDATITSSYTGSLTARTKFGEILTNLDAKFNTSDFEHTDHHWTEISTQIGKGHAYQLESKFGKVYLRKPK